MISKFAVVICFCLNRTHSVESVDNHAKEYGYVTAILIVLRKCKNGKHWIYHKNMYVFSPIVN